MGILFLIISLTYIMNTEHLLVISQGSGGCDLPGGGHQGGGLYVGVPPLGAHEIARERAVRRLRGAPRPCFIEWRGVEGVGGEGLQEA